MTSFDLTKIRRFDSVGSLVFQDEMTSTSDVAKALLATDSQELNLPLLVLCERQTAGRGQPGRQWHADRQSLTFTWCVDAMTLSPDRVGLLPLAIGAAVCESLQELDIDSPSLKWPNDVLVGSRKVCGILAERIRTPAGDRFLIGVGINVNQNQLPQQDSVFAVASLKQCAGKEFDIEDLLQRVLQRLCHGWTRFQGGQCVAADWVANLNTWFAFIGQPIQFQPVGSGSIVGVFRGVDVSGQLLIETASQLHKFSSGRIMRVEA